MAKKSKKAIAARRAKVKGTRKKAVAARRAKVKKTLKKAVVARRAKVKRAPKKAVAARWVKRKVPTPKMAAPVASPPLPLAFEVGNVAPSVATHGSGGGWDE